MRALHHVWAIRRKLRNHPVLTHVKHPEHAHTDQTDANQVDRDHQIEQPRHDQDQDAGDQGNDGGNVRSSDGHSKVSGMLWGNRIETRILPCGAVPR